MKHNIETIKRAIRRLAAKPRYRLACNDAMRWLAMAESEPDLAIAAEYVEIARAVIAAVDSRGLPSWMLTSPPLLARGAWQS